MSRSMVQPVVRVYVPMTELAAASITISPLLVERADDVDTEVELVVPPLAVAPYEYRLIDILKEYA